MNHARIETIRTALAAMSSQLTPGGDSVWRFTLLNGEPHIVTAKLDSDWLLFEADYGGQAQYPELFWNALVRNASLEGLAKLVLAHDGSLRLRAEIPALEGVDLMKRVRETCSGFEAAWTHQDETSAPETTPAAGTETMDLKGFCSEAGWPFVERGGRILAVELEVPGGYCQALLMPERNGVRVSCELAPLDAIPEQSRPAVGGFLLAASGLVRTVRASVDSQGTFPAARFEVVFGTALNPSEFSSALECLSVACSCCVEEVKTLQVPDLAELYIALRGWGLNPAGRRNERTGTP
jgi:hypothetical protein